MSNLPLRGHNRAPLRDITNQKSSQNVSRNSDASDALQQAKKQVLPVVRELTGFGKETQNQDLGKLMIR